MLKHRSNITIIKYFAFFLFWIMHPATQLGALSKRGIPNYSAGSRSYGVSRMADDILGENLYPPRDEIPKSSLRRSNNPTRKHSYQSSLDTDRFSDRSSPESRTGMNLTSGFDRKSLQLRCYFRSNCLFTSGHRKSLCFEFFRAIAL